MAKKKFSPPDAPAPLFDGFSNETIKFLRGLKKNNNKEWFEAHRSDYEAYAREPFKALVAAMGERFRSHKLPLRADAKSLFRINRDIRFSNDKSPYKTHLGAWFPVEGLSKEEWGGMYFGLEPEGASGVKTFVGGGVHMPMPPHLKRIRTKIASDYKKLEKLMEDKTFKKFYPEGLKGESLKRIPQGFSEDHPAATLLKLKDFTVNSMISKDEFLSEELPDILLEKFKAALPVTLFLSK